MDVREYGLPIPRSDPPLSKEEQMNEHPYSTKLGDIGFGTLFTMVNYRGSFIRVKSLDKLLLIAPNKPPSRAIMTDTTIYKPFNDDGFHVPIVELSTGILFYMSKKKLCYIYPGEDRK